MAGLFGRKKKDEAPANSSTPTNNGQPQQPPQQPPQHQRPPPSPNGLSGINGSSGSMQGGIPTNGYNDHNGNGGPRSPMSPSFPQHNSGSNFGMQPQPSHSPMMNGPPSPQQSFQPGFAGPPGTVASTAGLGGAGAMVPGAAGAMMTTPQLFWTQRRILGTNPFPRFQHTSSIIANGTDIYLYGGSQRGATKGDLFILDSGKATIFLFPESD